MVECVVMMKEEMMKEGGHQRTYAWMGIFHRANPYILKVNIQGHALFFFQVHPFEGYPLTNLVGLALPFCAQNLCLPSHAREVEARLIEIRCDSFFSQPPLHLPPMAVFLI